MLHDQELSSSGAKLCFVCIGKVTFMFLSLRIVHEPCRETADMTHFVSHGYGESVLVRNRGYVTILSDEYSALLCTYIIYNIT